MTHEKDWDEKYPISLNLLTTSDGFERISGVSSSAKSDGRKVKQATSTVIGQLVASARSAAVNDADGVKLNWITQATESDVKWKLNYKPSAVEFMILLKIFLC